MKNKKPKYPKPEIYLTIIILSLMFIQVGGAMNFVVIQENKGRMPVLSDYKIDSDTHFSYKEDNKPENWILSDFIDTKYYIYSIGDLLMIFSYIVMGVFASCYVREKWK